MNQISLLLENQDVEAVDGVTFDRLNPMTGNVATRAAAAQIADATRAADAAAAAFPAWSATGPSRRRMILQPQDIAAAVRFLADLPPHAHVPELVIKPTIDDFS